MRYNIAYEYKNIYFPYFDLLINARWQSMIDVIGIPRIL